MKLRGTILLLAGVLLLLCAASQPQPNSQNPKDARKVRYAQRGKLSNDKAAEKSDISDPNAPLSLLPAGEEVDPQGEDAPNKAPDPLQLKDGKTASASLDVAPTELATETSSVRSLAIDGAPYGEVRKPVQKSAPVKTPQVVASNLAVPNTAAKVPPIADNTKLARATASAKPLPVKQSAAKPGDQKLLAANSKPSAAGVPRLNPVPVPKVARSVASSAVPAARPQPVKPTASQEVVPGSAVDEAQQSTEDRFKWLDEHLTKDLGNAEHSATDDLVASAAPAMADAPLSAEGGEPLTQADKSPLDDTQLEPLGIPGQRTVARAPGRLRGWLFGLCGVFALGALVVAIPRPRAVRGAKAADDGLTLIESINMAEGRQLVILRKKHYALVLGVTRSATHLLEKVSMASLDSDYNTVINTIIKRESESPELWRMRPLFSGSYRTDYAPEERAAPARVTSLSELRASLHVVGPARIASAPPAVRQSMGELRGRSDVPEVTSRRPASAHVSSREVVIRRIREQARRAS